MRRGDGRRWRAGAIAQLAVLGSTACATTEFDAAPLELTCAVGIVRGHSQADVEHVARLAEALDPQVVAIIQPRQAEALRIVVVPPHPDQPSEATCVIAGDTGAWRRKFIAIRTEPAARGYILAHELVHWHADWAWDHLPLAVEEGLAELVAGDLDRELGAVRRAYLARLGIPDAEEVRRMLVVERGTERELDARSRQMLYWIGKRVAQRIGVDRLRHWCEQAASRGHGPLPIEVFLAPDEQ